MTDLLRQRLIVTGGLIAFLLAVFFTYRTYQQYQSSVTLTERTEIEDQSVEHDVKTDIQRIKNAYLFGKKPVPKPVEVLAEPAEVLEVQQPVEYIPTPLALTISGLLIAPEGESIALVRLNGRLLTLKEGYQFSDNGDVSVTEINAERLVIDNKGYPQEYLLEKPEKIAGIRQLGPDQN